MGCCASSPDRSMERRADDVTPNKSKSPQTTPPPSSSAASNAQQSSPPSMRPIKVNTHGKPTELRIQFADRVKAQQQEAMIGVSLDGRMHTTVIPSKDFNKHCETTRRYPSDLERGIRTLFDQNNGCIATVVFTSTIGQQTSAYVIPSLLEMIGAQPLKTIEMCKMRFLPEELYSRCASPKQLDKVSIDMEKVYVEGLSTTWRHFQVPLKWLKGCHISHLHITNWLNDKDILGVIVACLKQFSSPPLTITAQIDDVEMLESVSALAGCCEKLNFSLNMKTTRYMKDGHLAQFGGLDACNPTDQETIIESLHTIKGVKNFADFTIVDIPLQTETDVGFWKRALLNVHCSRLELKLDLEAKTFTYNHARRNYVESKPGCDEMECRRGLMMGLVEWTNGQAQWSKP